ncbi:hypothetical protein CAPTEDRAFT_220910 [Capitella teleta]|uniref:SnoaL-like domain-containing protein n=1 Tax=Capitella teleta TaxID=283909 RepID=R7TIS5_CAPTE|nr:hypothetical protein CAPTEDRAFT_220910 [Capitella teleta]|eukprot:ELT93629.1 hypothetical protein CAPTEDRAFT_220910 [Capitella teleta]
MSHLLWLEARKFVSMVTSSIIYVVSLLFASYTDEDRSLMDEFRVQVMEYIDAYNSGDNDRLCACYAPDAWAFFPEADIIVVPEVASAVLNRLERCGAIANLYHQLLEMHVLGTSFGFSAGIFTAVDPEGRATGRYNLDCLVNFIDVSEHWSRFVFITIKLI